MIIDNNKLKNQLATKGVKKSDLPALLGISSRTIAKIAKNEDLKPEIVAKIAYFLECAPKDLMIKNQILATLQQEKKTKLKGGLYHQTQIKLTYNSNHIEGSRLSEEQTHYIFETQTVGNLTPDIPLDDVIETNNHFKCIDYVIDNAQNLLSEEYICDLHRILKTGTQAGSIYGCGRYKILPNIVGETQTCPPKKVPQMMKKLIEHYNKIKNPTLVDIVEFHKNFEGIHPFQDGNGRVGRLIAFGECLKNNIVPFYIDDKNKWFYYRGLREWADEPNFLIETCRLGQDQYRQILDYFEIDY